MTSKLKAIQSTPPAPKCPVCTTPTRCGAPALHTKGPRCVGKADGMDDCDCLNACGDDPWIESGRSMPCEHRRETQARIARIAGGALDAALDAFENKERGIPQAHIAAALVAELRATIDAARAAQEVK